MAIGLKMTCAGLAALLLMTGTAVAKVCKDESVSATSRSYLSRSLGAFPGSWAAWRKEVKNRYGNGWQAWRRSEDRSINCAQEGRRWTCTRTARPCRPGSGDTAGPIDPGVELTPIDRVLSRNMWVRPGERREVEAQVKTLQYLLNEAGFYVKIDGDFGRATQEALIAFQRKNRLAVDGRAGPETVEALTS